MSARIYELRIALRGSKPPIWRRVAVPSDITLGQLHEIIQVAMGWTDSHLHNFVLRDASLKASPQELARLLRDERWDRLAIASRGERTFSPMQDPMGGDLDMEGEDEYQVKLSDVCTQPKSKLLYSYDFGDGWEHDVTVQKIHEPVEGVKYPVCLAGKLACPAEDCGGIWGYYRLIEILNDPKHPEHADMMEWVGEPIDPEHFDIDAANKGLMRWHEFYYGKKKRSPKRDRSAS